MHWCIFILVAVCIGWIQSWQRLKHASIDPAISTGDDPNCCTISKGPTMSYLPALKCQKHRGHLTDNVVWLILNTFNAVSINSINQSVHYVNQSSLRLGRNWETCRTPVLFPGSSSISFSERSNSEQSGLTLKRRAPKTRSLNMAEYSGKAKGKLRLIMKPQSSLSRETCETWRCAVALR